ncbi:MAG: GNAT family N-acetyltransferase [Gemmatimonadaceae bacterium]
MRTHRPGHGRVSLEQARVIDEPVLANLLQLYIHDLSEIFPKVALGADGRFDYPRLPLYWSEPERRFPFLIRCNDRLAGFALATRGSPATSDPDVMDVAEFFVIRQLRRSSVGRDAAFLLWNRFPGRWTIRVAAHHASGIAFWSRVIGEYTKGAVTESANTRLTTDWRVFTLDSVK